MKVGFSSVHMNKITIYKFNFIALILSTVNSQAILCWKMLNIYVLMMKNFHFIWSKPLYIPWEVLHFYIYMTNYFNDVICMTQERFLYLKFQGITFILYYEVTNVTFLFYDNNFHIFLILEAVFFF